MRHLTARLRGLPGSPEGGKAIRYTVVSLVSVGLNQATLAVVFGVLRWAAVPANLLATVVATVPTYVLNRSWVWGRRGRSHVVKEVLPFGLLSVLGLVLSSLAASAAERAGRAVTDSRSVQTVIVMGATLVTFGILWAARFVFLNKVLFAGAGEGPAVPAVRAPDLESSSV
jgi:putative flippase GtrA